ncbi:hypothetical protein [Acinetobacter baumannii]|uniref:hypothetical protein n=1 Tax=Acinetobacter baumannii TaxID=470 RepID=UPI0014810065|nr:hypothetical protein [Acinetobacter baumannii]
MADEITVIQATIEAARIQKWGTIWGAVIGGIAIAVGVYFSWRTSYAAFREYWSICD